MDSPPQDVHENRMVDVVKERRYIAFDKPFNPAEIALQLHERGVTASVWTKAVRTVGKGRFIDGL